MSREDSPFIIGEYWLDKRRDGKAPDIWQIASYKSQSRSVVYRSTRRSGLEEAIAEIRAFDERERAKGVQRPEEAAVVPQLFTYWDERGKEADSASQIASSIRQFIGFLMQDEAGLGVTVAQMDPALFERFRRWRMGPHSYSVPWAGRTMSHASKGVCGESVQRNFDDIRGALGHQVKAQRLPYAPKGMAVEKRYRSKPRDLVLTRKQMGAIIGYCAYDIAMLRWVLLMTATAMRPEAALAMDPAAQRVSDQLLDLHPQAWPQTKKVNPIVPVIAPFRPWLDAWADNPHKSALSRKKAWRTMRAALGLPPRVVPKTIRHTVATRLHGLRVRAEEVETLLGHRVLKKTTAVYAKYDPDYLSEVKAALTTVFCDYCDAAKEWLADHLLTTAKFNRIEVLAKNGRNASVSASNGGL